MDWSIQEIARLAHTTSRTLRHYGEMGSSLRRGSEATATAITTSGRSCGCNASCCCASSASGCRR